MRSATLVVVCAVAFVARPALGADAPAPPAPPVVIFKSTTTSAGQPVVAPAAPVEVTAAISEIAADGTTPVHQHPFPRFGYVLSGRVEVVNIDTGETQVFETGQFFIDPVGPWHQGRALDGKPVKLLVIDQTPPGRSNLIRRDAPAAPAK